MRKQRGGTDIVVFVVLVILAVLIYNLLGWGEREGVAKFDDCRERVFIGPDSLKAYLNTFTCQISKTKSGQVMDGVCIHIEYGDGLFSGGNSCKVAYIYHKERAKVCTDPAFPFLNYDDKCYANQ